MEMVSIKKFLRAGKPGPGEYIRFLQLLLEGISLHAVEASETDLTRFRNEVSAISEKLSERSSSQEIEAAVDFVIRAVDGYNRIAARIAQAHLGELQAMLVMTTETIRFLGDSSKTGMEQLQTVEKNLQKASTVRDIRELRGQLDDCLALVRSERQRLHQESRARIAVLRGGVERTANHVRAAGAVVPDLPVIRRDNAEQLIADKIAQGHEFAVALFAVDGLTQIAARYGPDTGDEVLSQVTQYLEQKLGCGSLFRWSGPAMAAVIEFQSPLAEIEQRMHQIAALRLEKTIETDGRFILIPITCSVIVQKVSDADSLDAVAANLDDFVAARS